MAPNSQLDSTMADELSVELQSMELLHQECARLVRSCADEALSRGDIFTLALSGGSTPLGLFRLLSQGFVHLPIDRTHLFWCDERCVEYSDESSNFGQACRIWLDHAGFPESNLHPIATTMFPEQAAGRYEHELRKFFPGKGPSFDLSLLGMGPDGHTASVFPGSTSLDETESWAISSFPPDGVEPNVARVSLSLAFIARSKKTVMLIAGQKKITLARRIMAQDPTVKKLPAARLSRLCKIYWYMARDLM